MALLPSLRSIQPMPESQRFRVAVVVSLAVHLAVLLAIARAPARTPEPAPAEPIEVSLTAASPQAEAHPQVRPEPETQTELQAKPVRVPPPPKHAVKMKVPRTPRVAKSHALGGGHPDAPVVRNPSPLRSLHPSSRPASNAGGKAPAAPAPPNLLTSKRGTTPAGPVGKGSAPSGPGGRGEVAGGGPTYGPGVVGGPSPIYPKTALDQGWEGSVTLAVTVSADGKLAAVAIAKSSGHDALDQAALRAVRRGWTFKSGMAKGKPAPGSVNVVFSFSKGEVTKG